MRVPEETMNFAQRIRTNALLVLYNYWKELRGSRPYPTRADIDPSMIPAVLPNIGLFDVEDAPRRYRIRLMGTQIVTWYGCDITGRYLDEIDFGGRTGFPFSLLDQVVDRCVPGPMPGQPRSEELRVGQGGVRRFRTRGSRGH